MAMSHHTQIVQGSLHAIVTHYLTHLVPEPRKLFPNSYLAKMFNILRLRGRNLC